MQTSGKADVVAVETLFWSAAPKLIHLHKSFFLFFFTFRLLLAIAQKGPLVLQVDVVEL